MLHHDSHHHFMGSLDGDQEQTYVKRRLSATQSTNDNGHIAMQSVSPGDVAVIPKGDVTKVSASSAPRSSIAAGLSLDKESDSALANIEFALNPNAKKLLSWVFFRETLVQLFSALLGRTLPTQTVGIKTANLAIDATQDQRDLASKFVWIADNISTPGQIITCNLYYMRELWVAFREREKRFNVEPSAVELSRQALIASQSDAANSTHKAKLERLQEENDFLGTRDPHARRLKRLKRSELNVFASEGSKAFDDYCKAILNIGNKKSKLMKSLPVVILKLIVAEIPPGLLVLLASCVAVIGRLLSLTLRIIPFAIAILMLPLRAFAESRRMHYRDLKIFNRVDHCNSLIFIALVSGALTAISYFGLGILTDYAVLPFALTVLAIILLSAAAAAISFDGMQSKNRAITKLQATRVASLRKDIGPDAIIQDPAQRQTTPLLQLAQPPADGAHLKDPNSGPNNPDYYASRLAEVIPETIPLERQRVGKQGGMERAAFMSGLFYSATALSVLEELCRMLIEGTTSTLANCVAKPAINTVRGYCV